MVRMLVREPQNDDIHYVELAGLSTDEKPTGFATGSLFMEVDTGDAYLYNEEGDPGEEWVKVGGDSDG